jgi:hypothetical protein
MPGLPSSQMNTLTPAEAELVELIAFPSRCRVRCDKQFCSVATRNSSTRLAAFARLDTAGTCSKEDEELARSTYFRNTNHDDRELYKWKRVLRLGSTPIGAIVRNFPFDCG